MSILKKSLRLLGGKKVKNFFHYEKSKKWESSSKRLSYQSVFFCDVGNPPVDAMVSRAIAEGARVFIKTGEAIVRADLVGEPRFSMEVLRREVAAEYEEIQERCVRVAGVFEKESLHLDWVLEMSKGFCVEELFRPYLVNFFRHELPRFLWDVLALKHFFEKQSIHAVVCRGSVGRDSSAALNAAQESDVVKVCLQHSCCALDLRDWSLDDLDLFDYYLAADSLSKAYFESCAEEPHLNRCEVRECSQYLRSLGKVALKKRSDQKVAVYFAKKFPGYKLRFNTTIYPITWYFEFQKALLRAFALRKDYRFIYKYEVRQTWAKEAMLPYIQKLKTENIAVTKANNVAIESRPIENYFGKGYRLIFDYPSTGFFEAAAAGESVMCLSWDLFNRWPGYEKAFGKSLQDFKTTEEAIRAIELFLSSKAEDYRPRLTYSKGDLVDLLEGVLK